MSPPGSSARHSPAASGASAERWLQKAFGEASVNVVDRASARREEVRWTPRPRARPGGGGRRGGGGGFYGGGGGGGGVGVRGGVRDRRGSCVGARGGGGGVGARARANGSRATRDFETVFKRSNSEDSGGRARRREVGDARG